MPKLLTCFFTVTISAPNVTLCHLFLQTPVFLAYHYGSPQKVKREFNPNWDIIPSRAGLTLFFSYRYFSLLYLRLEVKLRIGELSFPGLGVCREATPSSYEDHGIPWSPACQVL